MDYRDIALIEEPSAATATVERALDPSAFFYATHLDAPRQLTLGMVHEMNNVIGGIAVLSEIYQEASGGDEGLTEGLSLIHKSAGRLQAMVDHLKILHGPATEEPTYLNLSETIRSLFEFFAPLLPKTWTVETTFPPEELVVQQDAAVLRRVLLNLVLNLRDDLSRRPEAVRKLQICLQRRSDTTAELVLSTDSDSGETSLSADDRARLDDARERLREMGGTLIASSSGEFLLALPLIA